MLPTAAASVLGVLGDLAKSIEFIRVDDGHDATPTAGQEHGLVREVGTIDERAELTLASETGNTSVMG